MDNINMITCATWVARGVANPQPEKVNNASSVMGNFEYKNTEKKNKAHKSTPEKKSKTDAEDSESDEESSNIPEEYGAAFKDQSEDEYLREANFDSDEEDEQILPTDNLIAACRQEANLATLEIHVYNSMTQSLYVHHDILLAEEPPLCMEWLSYNPTGGSSNLLAIGNMSCVIDVWNLDEKNGLDPEYCLPGVKVNRAKGKKKLSHTDAVISLAWNKEHEHLLASGSADNSVILWDLDKLESAKRIEEFSGKVQSVKWQPSDYQKLLTGDCDSKAKFIDCNEYQVVREWDFDGEVECVLWDELSSGSNRFLASTEAGTIFCCDVRQPEPIFKFRAHEAACTDLVMSKRCPGCLVTVSEDGFLRVWDITDNSAELVEEKQEKVGAIFTASSSTDDPFVFCFGGDNKDNNFKVWDIRNSLKVRQRFCPRLGLPTDEEEKDKAGWSKRESEVPSTSETMPVQPKKTKTPLNLQDKKQVSEAVRQKNKKKEKNKKQKDKN